MKLDELKTLGHDLIEECILYIPREQGFSKRQCVYREMERRMDKTPHFGQMKDQKAVKLAIGTLKKMLGKYKYETASKPSLQRTLHD